MAAALVFDAGGFEMAEDLDLPEARGSRTTENVATDGESSAHETCMARGFGAPSGSGVTSTVEINSSGLPPLRRAVATSRLVPGDVHARCWLEPGTPLMEMGWASELS